MQRSADASAGSRCQLARSWIISAGRSQKFVSSPDRDCARLCEGDGGGDFSREKASTSADRGDGGGDGSSRLGGAGFTSTAACGALRKKSMARSLAAIDRSCGLCEATKAWRGLLVREDGPPARGAPCGAPCDAKSEHEGTDRFLKKAEPWLALR